MAWVDKPQNYKDMYGIMQLLQGFPFGHISAETY